MFTEIGIENFKAFGKMQRIPLKPITLLYGPNSSGKSSLLQALLMFKQTLEEAHNKNIVLLPNGSLVDLGGYTEFVNGHNKNKNFSFGITMNCENYPEDLDENDFDKVHSLRYTGDPISLEFAFQQDKTGETLVSSIKVADKLGAEPVASYVDVLSIPELRKIIMAKKWADGQNDKDVAQRNWIAELKRSVLVRESMKLDGPLGSLIDIGSRLDYLESDIETIEGQINKGTIGREGPIFTIPLSPQKIQQDLAVLKRVAQALENGSNEQLSEIKEVPFDRLVSLSNCCPSGLMSGKEKCFKDIGDFEFYGATGPRDSWQFYMFSLPTNLLLHAGWMFKRFLRDMIYIGPLRALPERMYSCSGNIPSDVGPSGRYMPDILAGRPEILEKVNAWFERLEMGYDIDIRPVGRNHFEIVLIDRKTGWETNPKDVGFGVSQLMPIIVQGIISQNKTICIEQPEIHVHPRLQASLGSFFAECVARDPKNEDISPPRYNQFIIETHSENLILRLQKLIRKGELRKEDVAVIYFDKRPEGTEARELRLNDRGEFIDPWPDGFFEESFDEMFGD